MITLALIRVVNDVTPISVFALNLVTGAGLGLAIDYSLLLVSRYREELVRHGPGVEALRATLQTAGRTVAFSAVTVAAAFASLLVFPLGFLRSMAFGGLIIAPLAGLVALTVLPALFALLGTKVNALAPASWQRAAERAARPDERGGWYRFAHWVMRHPLPIAIASATVLIALGLPFLNARFIGVDASVLPPSAHARAAEDALRLHFPPGADSPIHVAATVADPAPTAGGDPPAAGDRHRRAAAAARRPPLGDRGDPARSCDERVHEVARPLDPPLAAGGGGGPHRVVPRHRGEPRPAPARRARSARGRHVRPALRRHAVGRPAAEGAADERARALGRVRAARPDLPGRTAARDC